MLWRVKRVRGSAKEFLEVPLIHYSRSNKQHISAVSFIRSFTFSPSRGYQSDQSGRVPNIVAALGHV